MNAECSSQQWSNEKEKQIVFGYSISNLSFFYLPTCHVSLDKVGCFFLNIVHVHIGNIFKRNQLHSILQDILLMKAYRLNTLMSSPVSLDLVNNLLPVKLSEEHRVLSFFVNMCSITCLVLMMFSLVGFPKQHSVSLQSVLTKLSLTRE